MTYYEDERLPDAGALSWREFIQTVRPGQYESPDYADSEYGYWEYALFHLVGDLKGSWTNTDPDPYWRSLIEGIKRDGIIEPVPIEQDDLEYYAADGHHRVAIARGFDIDIPYVVIRRAIP